MQDKDYNYKYTKYPDIFKRYTWGISSGLKPDDQIIKNRNNFVEEYDISFNRHKWSPKKFYKHFNPESDIFYDHKECYYINSYPRNKSLFVFSVNPNEEKHELIIKEGWQEIYPIYDMYKKSYIKIC